MSLKKRGLGRGLSDLGVHELLNDLNAPPTHVDINSSIPYKTLSILQLEPGRYQPRKHILQESLEELAQSIRVQGIIQPLVVRPISSTRYEIIAGERRWRAAQLAGLTEIPVISREISDETAIAVALIENIQRQDLNAIEEAIAYQRLLNEFGMTHEKVALAVGKARSSISNSLRLLKLSDEVRHWLESGKLEMGHARALLAIDDSKQTEVAQRIINLTLSVRDTEKMIRKFNFTTENKSSLSASNSKQLPDYNTKRLQKNLSNHFGTKVRIKVSSDGQGKFIIHYRNSLEFDNLLQKIGLTEK